MTIRPELLDELLKDDQTPQDLFGENGIIKQLTKGMIERCLQAEMEAHLGYPRHGRKKPESANTRNGAGQKTLKSEHGELAISVPRDRDGSFEPLLVKKRQSRLEGFEEKILALYARGMTTRDIQAQLQELYGVEVSPTCISNVTEEVMDEVRQWQNRSLEPLYPILYVDCLVVKVRENQRVINKAVYLALAVTMEGQKEVLGMWMSENAGAKCWLSVFTELQNRDTRDCFIACVDGLTGLPEAIEAVFPHTRVQLCLVHAGRATRSSTYPTSTAKRSPLTSRRFTELRPRPRPNSTWNCLPRNGINSIPPSANPGGHSGHASSRCSPSQRIFGIRHLHHQCHRVGQHDLTASVTRNHRIFPSDQAVYKVLSLAMQNIAKKWTMPLHDWKPPLNRFAIEFAGRFPQ